MNMGFAVVFMPLGAYTSLGIITSGSTCISHVCLPAQSQLIGEWYIYMPYKYGTQCH